MSEMIESSPRVRLISNFLFKKHFNVIIISIEVLRHTIHSFNLLLSCLQLFLSTMPSLKCKFIMSTSSLLAIQIWYFTSHHEILFIPWTHLFNIRILLMMKVCSTAVLTGTRIIEYVIDVRLVFIFISLVFTVNLFLALLLWWDKDRFNAWVFRPIIDATSLIFNGLLPSSPVVVQILLVS